MFAYFPMSGPHTEPHFIGPLGELRKGLLGFWTYTKAFGKDPKRFENSASRFSKLTRDQIGNAALYFRVPEVPDKHDGFFRLIFV